MTFNEHVMSESSGTIVSAFATTASALIVAYVLGAILGINRLVWIGTHQGTFYWAYCLSFTFVSLIAFVFFWQRVTTGAGAAAVVGLIVGYVGSCVSAIAMYFQRGVNGPLNAISQQVAAFGIARALETIFVTVIFTGGIVYGLVAGLLIFAIARRLWMFAVTLIIAAFFVGVAFIIAAPHGARLHHIQLWP